MFISSGYIGKQPETNNLTSNKNGAIVKEKIEEFRKIQTDNGLFDARRKNQAKTWLWERIQSGLSQEFKEHPGVLALLPQLQTQVEQGSIAASVAARKILDIFKTDYKRGA
jgi:LAO/AO transport system kinase